MVFYKRMILHHSKGHGYSVNDDTANGDIKGMCSESTMREEDDVLIPLPESNAESQLAKMLSHGRIRLGSGESDADSDAGEGKKVPRAPMLKRQLSKGSGRFTGSFRLKSTASSARLVQEKEKKKELNQSLATKTKHLKIVKAYDTVSFLDIIINGFSRVLILKKSYSREHVEPL